MGHHRYTIKDIAKLANVSRGTVDRVLHNRGRVSEESREKVQKILDEINYQPNLIARSLKHNQRFRLKVLTNQPDDPYWQLALKGIHKAMDEYNSFGVIIDIHHFFPNNPQSFLSTFMRLMEEKPDGIAVAPLTYSESIPLFEEAEKQGIPITVFNTPVDAKVSTFIGQDLYRSGRVGAELIAKLNRSGGEVAIVHIDEAYKNSRHIQEKERGFRAFFEDKPDYSILNLRIDRVDRTQQDEMLRNFFLNHPHIVGVLVTTSKVYRVADAMEKLNLSPSLVGYDLIPQNVSQLQEDKIDFLIHQNPQTQGYLSIYHLADFLLFQKVIPPEVLLPIDVVSKENVPFYLKDSWRNYLMDVVSS